MSTDWDTPDPAPVPGYGTPSPAGDPAPSHGGADALLSEPGVMEALAARDRADVARVEAETAMARAREAAADAEGAVAIARARVADLEDDDSKRPWERLAAAEDVERALRLVSQRDREIHAATVAADTAASECTRAQHAVEAAIAASELGGVSEAAADGDGDQPYYGNAVEFFEKFLRDAYMRSQDGRVWCARWWEVPEGLMRIEAMWRAWEHLRTDPTTGASVWWRDHADHHMNVLLSSSGPFANYTDEEDRLKPGQPLPHVSPPPGLFRDVREDPPAA
ncbi:DUF4913 domain-containing protein [Litorihabitans aurantiacus]|uniref:DUF4913 domain-containing protein n=1 Tax=Litorihabitans aurantiacus TaxID=1930061 RepID=A0AA37XI62_9MICO|nr:DUF4913 domain-containing protein [Litorihabitans aurantiacus]GMA33651.1 hypothetical protein GCM10025875_36430 [Litorihabitans aurantiacus]GMA33718.1 hypothetical protein GCM10025875_37100 [Litorihabitans aurantiacus]GMA33782.1 hypothetical protein GCM10025875_37740 [Litorihabitans aurantiacus]